MVRDGFPLVFKVFLLEFFGGSSGFVRFAFGVLFVGLFVGLFVRLSVCFCMFV